MLPTSSVRGFSLCRFFTNLLQPSYSSSVRVGFRVISKSIKKKKKRRVWLHGVLVAGLRSSLQRSGPSAAAAGSLAVACGLSVAAHGIKFPDQVLYGLPWVGESCLTLCDPTDCSPPGPSVHGILQARTLEWVAYPFSRGSSRPRNRTGVSRIAGGFVTCWAPRDALWSPLGVSVLLPEMLTPNTMLLTTCPSSLPTVAARKS